MFYER